MLESYSRMKLPFTHIGQFIVYAGSVYTYCTVVCLTHTICSLPSFLSYQEQTRRQDSWERNLKNTISNISKKFKTFIMSCNCFLWLWLKLYYNIIGTWKMLQEQIWDRHKVPRGICFLHYWFTLLVCITVQSMVLCFSLVSILPLV